MARHVAPGLVLVFLGAPGLLEAVIFLSSKPIQPIQHSAPFIDTSPTGE